MKKRKKRSRILAFDIGGTGIKAAVVGPGGKFLAPRVRVKTPDPRTPAIIVETLVTLAESFADYDRIAMGFPGYVRDGTVITAPNLGTGDWADFKLAATIAKRLGRPARLANDADMQGLAVIRGKGLELVATLGTGFGTAWFLDGRLLPHLEFSHVPVHGRHDFDAYIGDAELKRIGKKKWRKRVEKVIAILATVFNFDHLHLGGGNARHINFELPPDVSIVSNDAGLEGGAWLWHPRTGLK